MSATGRLESPYVGLVPYSETEARFFFGREREQQIIIANLFASKITILYGASGVGKSSLLQAGVIKELRPRANGPGTGIDEPALDVVYFNEWKLDALDQLKTAIRESSGAGSVAVGGATLREVVRDVCGRTLRDLMVICDQFEEYFLYHPNTVAPGTFAYEFAEAVNDNALPVNFLVSLRDDALSRLDRFKNLIPNLFASYIRVGHLTREDGMRAVLAPVVEYTNLADDAKVYSGPIGVEPSLVEAVLDDVRRDNVRLGGSGRGRVRGRSSDAIETPYLQLVMRKIWSEELGSGSNVLRLTTFERLGKAQTIVKTHLDDAMRRLSEAEQVMCARMFEFLVTPGGTKIAHTVADLAGFAGSTEQEIQPTLKRLSDSSMRILAPVASAQVQEGPIQYEIYHDSLAQAILEWRHRFVLRREQERQEHDRAIELARQQKELEHAQALAVAQRERAETEARGRARLRWALGVVVVMLGVAISLGLYAWRQRTQAYQNQRRALDAEGRASDLAAKATAGGRRATQLAEQAAVALQELAQTEQDLDAAREFEKRAADAQKRVEDLQAELKNLGRGGKAVEVPTNVPAQPPIETYRIVISAVDLVGAIPAADSWTFSVRESGKDPEIASFSLEPGSGTRRTVSHRFLVQFPRGNGVYLLFETFSVIAGASSRRASGQLHVIGWQELAQPYLKPVVPIRLPGASPRGAFLLQMSIHRVVAGKE